MARPGIVVLGFRGQALALSPRTWIPGLVALMVRALTKLPGQPFDESVAHVATFRQLDNGNWIEIEAVIPAIRRTPLRALPGEADGVIAQFEFNDASGAGWQWASEQVGKPYSLLAAALTGIEQLPGWRNEAGVLWGFLRAGRTAPLQCALLVAGMMQRAGVEGLADAALYSPNEIMQIGDRL